MGKGMDDGDRAKAHRLCLRSSLRSHDPRGDTWAWGPCTQGWRRHSHRIETSTKERENKLPTSNLHPVPATSTAQGHPPSRDGNRRPTPPIRLSAAERWVGARAPATSHTPLPLGPLTTVPEPLPRVRCPRVTRLEEKAGAGCTLKVVGKNRGLKGQISALPLWVTLGKSFNLSKRLFTRLCTVYLNNWLCDLRDKSPGKHPAPCLAPRRCWATAPPPPPHASQHHPGPPWAVSALPSSPRPR